VHATKEVEFMKLRRAAANRLRGGGKLVLALLLLTATTAFAAAVPGPAQPGTIRIRSRWRRSFAAAQTDLALRVDGRPQVSMLEHVQVKAWLPGGEVETCNFFDVPVEDGVATIPLAGRERS
jgi:hypothetical protein